MNLTKKLRAEAGEFRLRDHASDETLGFKRADIEEKQSALLVKLNELQARFYAQDRDALLIILQGMDAAGKDGIVKHVIGAVNPAGCSTKSFKTPTSTELEHDFLWRCHNEFPERGHFGIFNRSYYEEALIVRVHPEFLIQQKLPDKPKPPELWDCRLEDIRHFETYAARNGVRIVKFFLNIGKKEQAGRLLSRIDNPLRNWKITDSDLRERAYWKEYMKAYEAILDQTSTDQAPWYVIPADHKWFARYAVSSILVELLEKINPQYPVTEDSQKRKLLKLRQALALEAKG